jgi:UDP-2,4-diacetamido-2,4,6-trideoxy-beta-L-altropyranose hydrolase
MKICFRVDGGSHIGMGHIMRTLVLAKEFRNRGFEVFYACRIDKPLTNKYKIGIDKIKHDGFEIVFLYENTFFVDLINVKADCIITDSYDVDEEYFAFLRRNFKISGCLDDEKICQYFDVDFLINQNPYAKSLHYKGNCHTKFMLGTQYVILRNEFRGLKDILIKEKMKHIMVTVGGSDQQNLTERIISKLMKLDYQLHIVVGNGFTHAGELKKYESDDIKLYYNPQMSELMRNCDVAISSCGTTIYELFACGTPTVGIVAVDNQKLSAETLNKIGAIEYVDIENIDKVLSELTVVRRRAMSEQGKDFVDGWGYQRVVDGICNVLQKITR